MNPVEKYVRRIAREEAEAVAAAKDMKSTELVLRVDKEAVSNVVRPPSTRGNGEGRT